LGLSIADGSSLLLSSIVAQCIGLRFPGEANRDRLIELSIESGRMTQYTSFLFGPSCFQIAWNLPRDSPASPS
jgi:hypothetical protein